MSALAITEALDTTWAGRAADLSVVPPVESVRPVAAGSNWQLTERGIAVAVVTFLAVFLVAVGVLVGAFLAIPERPLEAGGGVAAALSVQR